MKPEHEDCRECRALDRAYEAATMSFFRLQNQFEIASLSGDCNALWSLAAEMDRLSTRRTELREKIQEHRGSGPAQLNTRNAASE